MSNDINSNKLRSLKQFSPISVMLLLVNINIFTWLENPCGISCKPRPVHIASTKDGAHLHSAGHVAIGGIIRSVEFNGATTAGSTSEDDVTFNAGDSVWVAVRFVIGRTSSKSFSGVALVFLAVCVEFTIPVVSDIEVVLLELNDGTSVDWTAATNGIIGASSIFVVLSLRTNLILNFRENAK